jgi:hypothetical protein
MLFLCLVASTMPLKTTNDFLKIHVLPKPLQPTIGGGLMIFIYALNFLSGEVFFLTILFLSKLGLFLCQDCLLPCCLHFFLQLLMV